MSLATLGRVALFEVKCPPMSNKAERLLDDMIGLCLPLRGSMRFLDGKRYREARSGWSGRVIGPGMPFGFVNSDYAVNFGVGLYKPIIDSYIERDPDQQVLSKLENYQLDLRRSRAAAFSRYVNFVWQEIGNGAAILESTIATADIEDTLMALFVEAIADGSRRATNHESWCVKRAAQFIEANLTQPVRVTEIAEAAGVMYPYAESRF